MTPAHRGPPTPDTIPSPVSIPFLIPFLVPFPGPCPVPIPFRLRFPDLFLALCLVLTGLLLTACGPSGTVEEQVRARIAAMEAAGEAGERVAFMGFVADGFEAQDRSMSRDDFRRFMFFQLNQRRRIQAQLFPITVEPQGPNLALARFKVLVTGGGLIPEDGQLFAVETQWMLDGGDWMLWRADWQPLGP